MRIEHVDHAGQASRQAILVTRECLLCVRITLGGTRGDLVGRERRPGAARMLALEPGTREERFEAAGPAAVAGRAGPLAVARPRQHVVAPFPGNRVGPRAELLTNHHAPARSCPDDHAENGRGSGRRAVRRLREREAVGIVGDEDRPPETVNKIGIEAPPDQPGRVRVLDQAGRRRH